MAIDSPQNIHSVIWNRDRAFGRMDTYWEEFIRDVTTLPRELSTWESMLVELSIVPLSLEAVVLLLPTPPRFTSGDWLRMELGMTRVFSAVSQGFVSLDAIIRVDTLALEEGADFCCSRAAFLVMGEDARVSSLLPFAVFLLDLEIERRTRVLFAGLLGAVLEPLLLRLVAGKLFFALLTERFFAVRLFTMAGDT